MLNPAQKIAQLNREAILSASPAKLLTMLYDRLMVDLHRAKSAQDSANWGAAAENLLHAQAIIAELSSSLDDSAWSGGAGLRSLYVFVTQLLIDANIQRNIQLTAQAIELLKPLQEAWHEAVASPGGPAVQHAGVNVG
ncbi:flagellar export chaperone FliS [Glutamicibacter soli]|uniref:flagellar export chaperone FliS n=1 Tax=Glutamicibacter soli TaxID=453836 RepID=UPI003C7141AC